MQGLHFYAADHAPQLLKAERAESNQFMDYLPDERRYHEQTEPQSSLVPSRVCRRQTAVELLTAPGSLN